MRSVTLLAAPDTALRRGLPLVVPIHPAGTSNPDHQRLDASCIAHFVEYDPATCWWDRRQRRYLRATECHSDGSDRYCNSLGATVGRLQQPRRQSSSRQSDRPSNVGNQRKLCACKFIARRQFLPHFIKKLAGANAK